MRRELLPRIGNLIEQWFIHRMMLPDELTWAQQVELAIWTYKLDIQWVNFCNSQEAVRLGYRYKQTISEDLFISGLNDHLESIHNKNQEHENEKVHYCKFV
jgi:hypothetical protein